MRADKDRPRGRSTGTRKAALRSEGAGTEGTVPFADNILAQVPGFVDPDDSEWARDPRWHDLPQDSHLWIALLSAAHAVDGEAPDGLYGALHGMRCLGAKLLTTSSGTRLQPGEIPLAEYRALRQKYLVPRANVLRTLLEQLTPDGGDADRSIA